MDQLGTLPDLNEALALRRTILEFHPHGHPERSTALSNLANVLHSRFKRLQTLPDLEEALTLERSALELRPQGHPERAVSLNNLALYHHTQFKRFGTLHDLEEALFFERRALELRPEGHPDRALSLGSIILYLHTLFSFVQDTNDLQEISTLYSQLSDIPPNVSFAVLKHCECLIHAGEEYTGHGTTVLASRTFLHIIAQHLAILPSFPQHLAALKRSPTPITVEFLEQGRGVFWNQLISLRHPLDKVIASGDREEIGSQVHAASFFPSHGA